MIRGAKKQQRAGSAGAGRPAAATAALKPHDAAALIIVDSDGALPKFLMGRRRPDQVFMPGMLVFPGGRVDDADRLAERMIAPEDDLCPAEIEKLLIGMRGRASQVRARALALAAVRETFEEAGLLVAGNGDTASSPAHAPANAGAPPLTFWDEFRSRGRAPSLARLRLVARAITPPGPPRRFDARFFYVPASAVTDRIAVENGELLDMQWMTLEEARAANLASITRVIVEDLADRMKAGALDASEWPVPFYYSRNGRFMRDLLVAPR